MTERNGGGEEILPRKLPIVPLLGRPIFPGVFTPVMITNPVDVKLIDETMAGEAVIGLVLAEKESDKPSIDDLYRIGTSAKIVKKINLPDGGVNIFISTLQRFKIIRSLRKADPIIAVIEYLEDKEDNTSEVKALTRALISEMKQISENNPLFSEEMRLNMVNIDNPGKIADFSASILNIEKKEQQKILETINVRVRMENVLVFIKKEQDIIRIQKRVQHEINQKVEKNQREYFLKEELKAIKTELGLPSDTKSSEYNRFKEQFAKFKFEGEIKETVDQELEKFNLMESNSAEFVVTRNYLDWISVLPWPDPPAEHIDLHSATNILENDHYGLKDVKSRIIEYLAVRKLRKDNRGSILCLVGPPGVGKTSVGRSVARALGKGFFRFSVGGMRDEGEIKGHRRTYIGAMPGKIIQGLKIVKTKSPVFMIDEIDKMGESHSGDPLSALLEVLDPEQNYSFRDHYLDLPFDVSRVFFIVTANTLDRIPGPLLDRMEVIELPGYIDTEKLEIAKNYLVPKSLEKNGLKKNQVKWPRESLLYIANGYAREAGVRNFEKNLDKVHRKLAKIIVEKQEAEAGEPNEKSSAAEESDYKAKTKTNSQAGDKTGEDKFIIDKKIIEEDLGKPIFPEGVYKKADKAGMSMGLAWTSMGGDTLLIEATSIPGKGGLTLTGKMGTVMKESATIAMTYARKLACEVYGVRTKWFERNHIHLHIPEGATPKDGPSAGITMAIALLSLFRNKVIKQQLAMTGELSLSGQVLPIGGLKEKSVAAQRNKAKHIIIPKQNLRDLDEIPDIVKSGVEFHPVERFEEVVALSFGEEECSAAPPVARRKRKPEADAKPKSK
ncbi:MAG: endopeptidase La [Spirochaetaceae bacterium]|jgi:ATP-dependent Lon protease|nr:endopeptidase La [Spirochaetaceae bacterium]